MSKLKTYLLLALLTILLVVIGDLIGGKSGMTIALVMAGVMNFVSYWWSDKIVLAMYRAKEVSPQEAPELHRIVSELAHAAGIPKPRVYIIPTDHPNAFATGRGPGHAAVAVTTGILNLLTERELRGVLSHELSHIRNRDVLIMTVAATIAGAITYLAYMARWAAIFGGFGGDDEDRGGNLLVILLISILAPLAAMIVQLAISRSREYLADATGAKISRDPLALASALRKLAYGAAKRPLQSANPATAHLFIVTPFRGGGITSLFSTHPPIEDRIRRLEEMAKRMGVS